jgi:predicted PurR-regulated permease PerM
MALTDQKTSRVLITILVFAAVLGFVWAARKTLIGFLFAVFFAYVIDPLVELVRRRARTSRGKAIAIVYLAIFAALAMLFLFIGPNIVRETEKLSGTIPDVYQKITSGQIASTIGAQHGWSFETIQKIQRFLASHSDTVAQAAREFGIRLAGLAKDAWWLVVIPILAVFFLKDGSKIRDAVLEVFERRRQRELVEGVVNDVDTILAHFIRAQLILAALTGVVFSIVLTVVRVPYGYVMGVIAGFLEFIPIVGPLVAALLIVGVAVGMGYKHIIVVVLFLGAWRVLQDYVTSPRIMGSQVELHPLAVLFGVLAGAEVGGIIGVYLSIPTMACLRIVWRRWHVYAAGPAITPGGEFAAISDETKRGRTA